MEIKVGETVVVRPAAAPFSEAHVLSLSHLDTDRNLLVILRYLRVYSGDNPNRRLDDPFRVITAALSAALVPYYPLAGSLRRRKADGRLELHCEPGDGVPVLSAGADFPISDLGSFSDRLAPDPNPDAYPARPISLQITRFSCGGFVLGAAVHHAVCDGLGATSFFSAVAEFARGSISATVTPVWERSALLGPRKPPRIEFPIADFLGLDGGFFPYSDPIVPARRQVLDVSEESVEGLKALLHSKTGSKFSTFEALGAFLWRARTRAYEVARAEKVTFAYSINIRKAMDPPLPSGYWGNGCVPMYVHLTAGEVAAERPIWETAAAIKRSKSYAGAEYVYSFVDFQELHYGDGINGGRTVSAFTDWRHLGHSGVDFGWGAPVAVEPLSRRLLGSVEPCLFLPAEDGGGLKVVVHLQENVIPAFRREMRELEILGKNKM